MTLLAICALLQGAGLLFALARIDRLTRAVRHHEHVLRLHLPEPPDFARLVLDEGAWDQERDGLLGTARAAEKGGTPCR